MKNERYIKAVSHIEPESGFEQKTLARLAGARKKRTLARILVPALSAVVCAALVLVCIPLLPGRDSGVGLPLRKDYASDSGMIAYEEPTEAYIMADGASYAMNYTGFDTEEYASFTPNAFLFTSTDPLSTFAADVDTASYTRTRRYLLNDELPDSGSVRIEEMINYFSYPELAPADGSTIGITTCLDRCPWNESSALLFVGVGTARPDMTQKMPSNLVFLVDVSGSMDSPDKLDLIKRAFALLVSELGENDTISLVTYAGSDTVRLDGVGGDKSDTILSSVEEMTAWGGTNGADAIVTAYSLAEKHFIPGGINRVILMTDGDLNIGLTSESELTALISGMRGKNIFLSVFGFGTGNLKDNKMEALADNGNGNYCYIDSLTEARSSLISQIGGSFRTVAKDVKLQVEFNPAVVSSYRLIGYEDRLLNNSDFADDTKDGGEMGSGHTVVALYEIVPAKDVTICGVTGTQETQQSLRYSSQTATGSGDICTVAVRYKEPEGDTSALIEAPVQNISSPSRSLVLASCVARFGMLLNGSEYAGTSSCDGILEDLRSLPELTERETELMYLVTRAKALGIN